MEKLYCPILKNVRGSQNLIKRLMYFLEKVFGKVWLEQELSKTQHKLHGKPEDFSFLVDVNIHQAAKWWALCNILERRGYKFDLRFMTDLEDFMELMLFCCNLNTLLEKGIINLEDRQFMGRLKDRRLFTSLVYELLVATNYVTQGYEVEFPEIMGKEPVDIHVKQDKVGAFVECKRLEYKALWSATAKQFLKKATKNGVNVATRVEVKRPPQKHPEAVKLAKLMMDIVKQESSSIPESGVEINFKSLPTLIEGSKFEVPLDSDADYLTLSGYVGVFRDGIKIRDPKIVAFKDIERMRRAKERLRENLKKASKQLLSIAGENKIICIDVSSVVRKIVLSIGEQDPEREELRDLMAKAKEWLRDHQNISAVILTWAKLYIDPLGVPTFFLIETMPITSRAEISDLPLFKGWTCETGILYLPEPINARSLTNIGAFLAENGFYARALKYYELAVKTDQSLKEAWNNMGRALNELGKFQDALTWLERALIIDPKYYSAWINKGISLANLGDLQEALNCFNKAIELNPNLAKAWYNKGLVLFKLKRVGEAAALCAKEALRINPQYDKAKELERLCRLYREDI